MSTDETNPIGKRTFHIRPGKPLDLGPVVGDAIPEGPAKDTVNRIGKTLRAYRNGIKELLKGKYASLADVAPEYMTSDCQILAMNTADGIFVRYDPIPDGKDKIAVGFPTDGEGLSELAPKLSESFLHCPPERKDYDPGERAITLTLAAGSGPNDQHRELMRQKICAVVSLQQLREGTEKLKGRLQPSISINNEFDLTLHMEIPSEADEQGSHFLVRRPFKIPVGWLSIQLFPAFDESTWNPDLASIWAERDLLAASLAKNTEQTHLREIDPHSASRKQFAKLFAEFESLLSENEEALHQFLKSNPALLSPAHKRVWSKLPLGKTITDFVFLEPSGEYQLVELEHPATHLFRADTQQRQELTHAINQIVDWLRYIEDNLKTVQSELGLTGISVSPHTAVVIGRSSMLNEETRRKLTTIANAAPKLKILTYDDVLANSKKTVENILGPIWDAGPEVDVYLLPKRN